MSVFVSASVPPRMMLTSYVEAVVRVSSTRIEVFAS